MSCSEHKEKVVQKEKFSTRHFNLSSDTTISSVAFLNRYLLLLQDNGKLVVLDTNYSRVKNIEDRLAFIKSSFVFNHNDTVFLGNKNKAYYLHGDFQPLEYKPKRSISGNSLFEDSVYIAYGCCVGEFGGAVFFYNKQTKKTYSYFATCATQVLRFGKDYVVCNNLAHLGENMSFLIVKEPTSLYEIKEDKLKNFCNWYTTIDSLRGYWNKSNVGSIRFYSDYNVMSLITFPYKDSLYSILSTSNSTVLAIHRGDTTITIDTLLNRKIFFHEAEVFENEKRAACLYRLTDGSPVAAYWVRGNSTGLIIVNGNRIDFLDKYKGK
jgi:hypothetical protein